MLANERAALERREEARRARRKASGRTCIVCGAVLSMYGSGNTCAIHISPKPLSDIMKQIKKRA
jgi:hypothetical protein